MMHTCHAVDCKEHVPPRLLMCRRHWFMVPEELRGNVEKTFVSGQERSKKPTFLYLLNASLAIAEVAEKEGKTQYAQVHREAAARWAARLIALKPEGRELLRRYAASRR